MQSKNVELENFYSRLQKALTARGSSLPILAADTGIALSTMYRWRDSAPQTRTAKQIAEHLRVSEEWLREGKGEMESKIGVREMAAQYKFTPRGSFPHPSTAADFQAGCMAMLNSMTHATTAAAFDYAVIAFEETWQKFKEAKYSEVNQPKS